MTLYRMTPYGVLDMANKNTGDVHGDTSFVLSRRTSAYECRQNPSSFFCNGVTQFQGDDKNSTDLVIAFKIEVDGQWGPYLPCNPVDSKKPQGAWQCDTTIGGGSTPPQCKAAGFRTYDKHCWKSLNPTVLQEATEGDCCVAATAHKTSKFTYFKANKTCELHTLAMPVPCEDGQLGYHSDETPACNCTRVHQTVGKENLSVAFSGYNSMHPAGGLWYSHPSLGECKHSQRIGDGSGCTWRVVQRERVVNASCVYGHLDANVEAHDKSCFTACPQPQNVTSDCYLGCYSRATNQMSHDELSAPWTAAFASTDKSKGGCPEVSV
jgi:hypothetical protein